MLKIKVGIIDAELIGRRKHRFPNLACMKMSGYYKKRGDVVTLLQSYEGLDAYDLVAVSKVFTSTPVPDEVLTLPNVVYGGTGFFYDKAPRLYDEIEHSFPDYHLYDEWVASRIEAGSKPKEFTYYTDYSIGFMTRGCIRQCEFCVNKNYKTCSLHSPVTEFVDMDRPYICLLDDNVFACREWKVAFDTLRETGKRFQFKQGLDERLLTDEKCEVLFSSKWIGEYIFAFDNIKDANIITEKLRMIRRHTDKRCKFYTFCGFNHKAPGEYPDGFWASDIEDLFKRIKILAEFACTPYVMRYADYEQSPHRGMYIAIAGWCNQPNIFKRMTFREFCNARSDRQRYMNAFESEYKAIAAQYFDWRYGDKVMRLESA